MIRGTRFLFGEEASEFIFIQMLLRQTALSAGYKELIVPALWEQQPFIDKAGKEIVNQMYSFKDKKGRDICLIPEVTAVVQELYNTQWSSLKKPIKLFYLAKCYRYERPQAGRYREFTQFGVEILGGKPPEDRAEIMRTIDGITRNLLPSGSFEIKDSVKRGLSYYVEDGFEVIIPKLGAQKQVLGGGRYKEGIGFGIGVERFLMASKL
jgi:histidyl-tRNA synthetase